tara:strand:+ start:693 stop:1070 length:378 start_codon:yes stop_codon:yes gene_type:complete
MQHLLAVGLGGFLGAIARHLLGGYVQARADSSFPWGTLAVNVLGCLLIGALLGWIQAREQFSDTTRLFLVTGILGSLTTFSTFGHETIDLVRQGSASAAVGNIALHVVAGLLAVAAGLGLSRLLG